MKPATQQRVLIVRLGSMGDVLHALPAVATLHESFPDWEMDWLVERRWRPLLVGNPCIARVVEADTASWRRNLLSLDAWNGFRKLVQELRDRSYDCAIDFQGLLKSAAACALSGARAVLGFDQPWLKEPAAAIFYTHRVAVAAVHVVDANLELARVLGAARKVMRFPLPEGDPSALPASLPEGDIAVLNPGAGWGSKRWSAERTGWLADLLEDEFGLPVVLNSGPGEEALAEEVRAACRRARPLIYSGDIPGLIALLRRARLMVGPDTGPLHLASALGVPVVGLFGPTDPARNGPCGAASVCLRAPGAVTSYRHSAGPAAEMDRIRPEEVAEAVRRLLGDRSTPAADSTEAVPSVPSGAIN